VKALATSEKTSACREDGPAGFMAREVSEKRVYHAAGRPAADDSLRYSAMSGCVAKLISPEA